MLEQFMNDCILWEGHQTEAGEEGEKEGVAEMKHYELTTTPIPHSPALLGGEEGEEQSGVKLSPGRKLGRGEEGGFSFVFYFSLSYSVINWQQIKLIFPKVSLFCL